MDSFLALLLVGTVLLQPVSSNENFTADFKTFVFNNEMNKKFFSFDTIPSQYITRSNNLKDPHIPIYTIQARFVDSLSSLKDTRSNSIVVRPMLLGLYTSQNIYLNPRDVKTPSDQPKFQLNSQDQQEIFDSPYLSINGTAMKMALFVDGKSFYNDEMSFIYCENGIEKNSFGLVAGNQVSGIIGMGISGSAKQNFHHGLPEFSIYLASSGSHGEIIFGVNQNLIDTDFHPLVYPASKNWEVNMEKSGIYFSDVEYFFNGKMILDINLDGIGFPYGIYKEILDKLIGQNLIECGGVSSGIEYCTVLSQKDSNQKRSLPDIILNNQYGNLTLPSELYVQGIPSSSGKMIYYFKIFGLLKEDQTSNVTQGRVIKIREGYEEHIILGSPFLSFYYVSFRQHSNGPVIHIYKSKRNDQFFIILMISSFVICALALLGALIYFIIRKKRQQTQPSQNQDQYYDISQSSF